MTTTKPPLDHGAANDSLFIIAKRNPDGLEKRCQELIAACNKRSALYKSHI
jgi:hypothetical protein